MEINERVLRLAQAVSGAGESELAVLEALCSAALGRWMARLRDGVSPRDCGEALACAAAYSAAADLAAGRGGVSAFTAGEISVQLQKGGQAGTAGELRRTAEVLMAPFVELGDLFLQGVRG